MCDYSLYAFGNRLANVGEHLVAYRFSSGCIGFASPTDITASKLNTGGSWFHQQWLVVKAWAAPRFYSGPAAVCLAPGCRLTVFPVAPALRKRHHLDELEEAVFIQSPGDEFTYRDGIRFRNGTEIKLQSLPAGQPVLVLSMPGEKDAEMEYSGVGNRGNQQ